jgi:hypothetical protein
LIKEKHYIVSDIKLVASKLGRAPTRREYLEQGSTGHSFERAFGTWGEALKAAGLESTKRQESSSKKLINDFYSKDIKDLLQRPAMSYGLSGSPIEGVTLAIGDMHEPWSCDGSVSLIYSLIEQIQPNRVIQMGDIYDMFSFAKFPRSRMIIRPDEEIRIARERAVRFWEQIGKLAPSCSRVQIVGNHDIRPVKRLLESNAPELEVFFNFKPLFEFEGVKTFHDPRENVIYDGVEYTHGHLKSGAHRLKLGKDVVHGHTHKGGVITSKVNGKWLTELDVGYAGDPQAPCFTYTQKTSDNRGWTKGCGLISPLGFKFIPFEQQDDQED